MLMTILFLTLFSMKISFLCEMLIIFACVFIPLCWESNEILKIYSMMFMWDKISISLIFISIWISVLIFMSMNNKTKSKKILFLMMMMLLFMLVFFFTSSSMLFLYIFFELSILPTMIIIMGWGYQPERLEASFFFFLYTVLASLPLLLGIISLNSDFIFFFNFVCVNKLISAMVVVAFLVKLPLFFFHSWLPKAHVEAPLWGSMILAGVLLKMGGYGILRLEKFFFNHMNLFIIIISLIGMIISGMICLFQVDLKSFIAYSSVSHMNFLVLGLFSMKFISLSGSIMLLLSHGLVSSLLFFLVNELFYQSSSRSLMINKFYSISIPLMSMMMFLSLSLNLAIPPSMGMVSELTISLISMIKLSFLILPILGVFFFLSAFYSIYMYMSLSHGMSEFIYLFKPVNFKSYLIFFGHISPLLLLLLNLNLVSLS